MAPRTRYVLIGSALVVGLGLCSGLVAYYGGSLAGRPAWRSTLEYVPERAEVVAFVDTNDVFASPFRQQLQHLLSTGDERKRLQNEMGVDVERDLDSVLLAVVANGPEVAGAVALLRGRFDHTQIEAALSSRGAFPETYRDVRVLTGSAAVAPGSGVDATPAVAFLEPDLLAVGSRQSVMASIDAAASGADVTRNAELMTAVAGVERAGNAWLAMRPTAVGAQSSLPDVVRPHLERLKFFTVAADVDESVRTVITAEAQDTQAADDLRGVVNGIVGVARLMGGRDARLESLLNSLQTSGSGSTLEVRFTVAPEVLDLAKEHGVLGPGQ